MSRYRRLTEADAEALAERIGMTLTEGEAASAAAYSDSDAYADLESAPLDALCDFSGSGDAYEAPPRRPTSGGNPHNAWISRFDLVRPSADGLLSGVEVGVKDNICVRGAELTNASRGFEGFVPGANAAVVERLLDAGARLRGKTNLDEFAMGPTSESSAFGPVTNPHGAERVAGGSSGGSGAAVAAGAVDLALGSDTGGSVRIPASYCGVVGIKPTHGRVSKRGFVTQGDSLEEIGPMAIDVETAARGMEVIADPLASGERERFVDDLGRNLDGTRLGVIDRYADGFARDPVVEEFDATLDRLNSLGATIETIEVPELDHVGAAWWGIGPAEFAAAYLTNDVGLWRRRAGIPSLAKGFERVRRATSDDISAVPKEVILLGAHLLFDHGGYHYVRAQNLRAALTDVVDASLDEYDALVTPSTPTVAPELGAFGTEEMPPPNGALAPANVTGHPALSVPCGDVDGLPVGLQLVGPWYAEKDLLDVASTFERGD
ncbi:amidase [Halegenticoccus tardaugens]|uniref:amidase n=1 Tax=Halegenticoccus tardaugens TaxID=2071624 RepID=UPI00100AF918|nr:amidase family protein [Halegenticoccus tardaugens]